MLTSGVLTRYPGSCVPHSGLSHTGNLSLISSPPATSLPPGSQTAQHPIHRWQLSKWQFGWCNCFPESKEVIVVCMAPLWLLLEAKEAPGIIFKAVAGPLPPDPSHYPWSCNPKLAAKQELGARCSRHTGHTLLPDRCLSQPLPGQSSVCV